MLSDILHGPLYEEHGNDNASLDNFTADALAVNDVDDAVTESEPDAEEEIDQLDSDSDLHQDLPAESPAQHSKKSSQIRSGERRRGHSLLPASRIENILQAEGIVGGSMNVSREAVFLLSIATEEFIRHFSTLGQGRAQYFNRNMVRYDDLAAVAENRHDFSFLRAVVPMPQPLHSAFAARNKRERDLLRDDPAMQLSQNGHEPPSRSPDLSNPELFPSQLAPCPLPKMQPKSQPQVRKRQSMKAVVSIAPHIAPNASIDNPVKLTETWEEYKERSRRLFGPGDGTRIRQSKSSTSLSNGRPSSQAIPPTPSISMIPSHLDDPDDISETGSFSDNKRRSPRPILHHYRPPLTGPGSAFLQGPGGPFPAPAPLASPNNNNSISVGSSSSSAVPPSGRTIYSKDISKDDAD